MRWAQLGFGRAASTSKAQATPRNLQGFKDGTNNLDATDTAEMRRYVRVGDDEPQAWMRGGTYVVTRRIRMLIETGDRSALGEQEDTIGRSKLSGAPLGVQAEHDPVDLKARKPNGDLVIPADADIREASHATNGGARILRRGYNYTDGIDAVTGELDAGLFFVCFQRDPHAQFAVLEGRLGAAATGARCGGYVGEGLFAG